MAAIEITIAPTSRTEKIRLFVAVFPPAGVVEALRETARRLGAEMSPRAVAWTLPEQIHLTLHFLGGVEQARVGEFEAALHNVCRATQGCLLRARGLGCFPGANRPRIIWAGLRGALEALDSVRQQLEPDFANLGYVPEKRPFHAHLTMGRAKELNADDRQHLARALERNRETDFGPWKVERIDLMQSVLAQSGARYSLLKSCALKRGDSEGPVAPDPHSVS